MFAVKEETKSEAVKSSRGASVSPQQPTVGELFEQLSVSEREELLFIQLPDAIPGQPKSISPEKKRKDDVKPADKHSPHVKAQVRSYFKLVLFLLNWHTEVQHCSI